MLQRETVLESTLDLLRKLQSLPGLSGLRLVGGTALASVDDIVAMKLSAAANRGKKKDFIDIATLLSKYTLAEMFTLYQKKFEVSEIGFAVRGLTYFQDAEEDPMPKMFTTLTWPDVKCRIIEAVKAFVVKDELTAGKDK